jgi:dephospho-CoA kinase
MDKVVWKKYGKDIIANDLLESNNELFNVGNVVISGPRTLEEVELFKATWNTIVIYVHANSKLRFKRYINSGEKHIYKLGRTEFLVKDMREFHCGLAEIASTDNIIRIFNENNLDKLHETVDEIIEQAS